MTADRGEDESTQDSSLEERVRLLEQELAELRRSAHRRNWAIEALLLLILLMGATAWMLWKG
ncbi:MAG TPA: hypothetical protein VM537_22905 [Anaerolineae bacterium]|nr:hypothetical protein [Anaerolineae bacterium]